MFALVGSEGEECTEYSDKCYSHVDGGGFKLKGHDEGVVELMEDFFGEVAAAADSEDGEHGGYWVVEEGVRLVVVVILKIDGALERNSCVWLYMIKGTSTRMKV